ncbi:uncharacterized protein ACNLHF_011612 isoform 1-T2 [Anomaloglossus baeobatrachus]|uniref:uncharacterized protein LOC142295845 isoform X1 n=2 Tax=Anomaloglossus baeobatrachus TaxID=238106 RepID=UPI003F4FFA99
MSIVQSGSSMMEKDRTSTAERILNLTLEILFQLTGENDKTMKNIYSDCCPAPVSEKWGRTMSPISLPPLKILIHKDINERKILELTNEITELLTGEVTIRCQDVAFFFSMEEWGYVEGHRDVYQDLIVEARRPVTSADEYRTSRTLESCPSCLYTQQCPEDVVQENYLDKDLIDIKVEVVDGEDHLNFMAEEKYGLHARNVTERYRPPLYSLQCPNTLQVREVTNIKVKEEEEMMNKQLWMSDVKEDIPGDDSTENPCKNSKESFNLSLRDKAEDEDVLQIALEEKFNTVNPELQSTDLSYNLPHEEPSYLSQNITTTKSQKGGKRFQCSECAKWFPYMSVLFTHKRIHTGERPYSCSECGKCFTCKSGLVQHEKIHTEEKPYSCAECGKCFKKKSSLVTHERIHTGIKPYSCSECGKCFMEKSKLVIHERIHTGEKPYSCSDCGKLFRDKSNFVTHKRIHTGEKPFSCSECEKCFTDKSSLVIHERSHTGEKPYSCSICGKCFTGKLSLVIHERTHTGVKPYSCSECEKCFKSKSNLVTHEKIHTGEKPYLCSECGKCFITKAKLKEHQRIHTGEKPFSCSECGRCFTGKSSLVIHERIHKGERPYSCSMCGKCFTDKSHLVKHERIHTGEKPYSCSECGKCFTDKSHLAKHQRSHTREKIN